MFTGQHASEFESSEGFEISAADSVWLRLRDERGYRTGVFSDNPYLSRPDADLSAGFDTVESLSTFDEKVTLGDIPSRAYIDAFLDWIDDGTGPWAACLNFMDTHLPYTPVPVFDEWGSDRLYWLQDSIDNPWEFEAGRRPWSEWMAMERLYDGTIRQVDDQIEYLVRKLEKRGALDATCLVITGDHGEGFGEQSNVRPGTRIRAHGNGIVHEAVLHVPLIIKHPGQSTGERVSTPVSLTSLKRFLLDVPSKEERARYPTDRAVIASTRGLTPGKRKYRELSEVCDNIWRFTGTARVLYEDDSDGVRKHAHWTSGDRSRAVTMLIPDAQSLRNLKEDTSRIIDRSFRDI